MRDRASISIREGQPGEAAALLAILDAAALQTDLETLRHALRAGTVLVATRAGSDASDVVLGVVVAPHSEQTTSRGPVSNRYAVITAIAVRPGVRGRGIGTALVEGLCETHDRLEAHFDPAVRPFWESLGFETTTLTAADRISGEYERIRGEGERILGENERIQGEDERIRGVLACPNED